MVNSDIDTPHHTGCSSSIWHDASLEQPHDTYLLAPNTIEQGVHRQLTGSNLPLCVTTSCLSCITTLSVRVPVSLPSAAPTFFFPLSLVFPERHLLNLADLLDQMQHDTAGLQKGAQGRHTHGCGTDSAFRSVQGITDHCMHASSLQWGLRVAQTACSFSTCTGATPHKQPVYNSDNAYLQRVFNKHGIDHSKRLSVLLFGLAAKAYIHEATSKACYKACW